MRWCLETTPPVLRQCIAVGFGLVGRDPGLVWLSTAKTGLQARQVIRCLRTQGACQLVVPCPPPPQPSVTLVYATMSLNVWLVCWSSVFANGSKHRAATARLFAEGDRGCLRRSRYVVSACSCLLCRAWTKSRSHCARCRVTCRRCRHGFARRLVTVTAVCVRCWCARAECVAVNASPKFEIRIMNLCPPKFP